MRKHPYTYKNSKGKDIFGFVSIDGEVHERVIPPQGINRYLFDKGEFDKLEYAYRQEARQNAQYSAILSDDMRRKYREKFFAKRESKYITDSRAEVNHMED